MNTNTPIRLRIPQPDLEEFTTFRLDEDAAQLWTQGLPVANTRKAAQQLRHVVSELNRVEISPELRFRIMEVLRPNLLIALSNLSKRFLNQPLIMPEEPRQMAELADSLYGLSATAYAMVAVHAIQQQSSIRELNPARLVCEAIHRGLSLSSRNILQALQLYQPVEQHLWLTLHQLYALAERQQLTQLPVTDPLSGSGTIACAYLQALMLGCSKPNQLRQSDLAGIYRGLQQWSEFAELIPPGMGEGMFLVDLGSDKPPVYSAMYHGAPSLQHRQIRTEALIEHLTTLRQQCKRQGKPGLQFDESSGIPLNIMDHLAKSLGTMSMRNYARISSDSNIWITIGLSSTHYHLAGGRTFGQLLYGDDYSPSAEQRAHYNPFLHLPEADEKEEQAEHDDMGDSGSQSDLPEIIVEEIGLSMLDSPEDEETPPEQRYPVHCVRMVNASPAGYGLEWPADMSSDLKTGNIVSVREEDSDDWSIAAVRWVNQPKSHRTVVGVELLSPGAQPFGAVIHQKTGSEAQPMRVLLLPEIKLVGQPHTLITPRAGFKERQKVTLARAGEEFLIQLQRQISVTGSFAQFDFRYIKQLEEVVAEDKSGPLDSAYDSVWSNI